MKKVFEGNMDEYDRIIKEDFVSGEWGDRRQERIWMDELGPRCKGSDECKFIYIEMNK